MNINESLLQKLKSLYSRLFHISLLNRTNHYHPNPEITHHQEFGETLHGLIDEIIIDISKTNSLLIDGHQISTQIEFNIKLSSPTIPVNDKDKEPSPADGLSLYFKNNKALESDPPMAARLRRRIWDHIHSAHRLARSGDGHAAKTHADIAIDAMKTLSHYMPHEEYVEFYNIIRVQMNDKNNFLFNLPEDQINKQ